MGIIIDKIYWKWNNKFSLPINIGDNISNKLLSSSFNQSALDPSIYFATSEKKMPWKLEVNNDGKVEAIYYRYGCSFPGYQIWNNKMSNVITEFDQKLERVDVKYVGNKLVLVFSNRFLKMAIIYFHDGASD